MRDLDVSSYLKRRGILIEALAKFPETADEIPRVAFLEENYFKAKDELRRYTIVAVAAPLTAPTFYMLRPSPFMLCCSVGFAAVIVCMSIVRILRRKRAMKDYVCGLERLVVMMRQRGAHE